MKLELPVALSLIMALPAHRSDNEGHRYLGMKGIDFLLEFRDLGEDGTETAFNRAMVSSVLSALRAFSVERDKWGENWRSLEIAKQQSQDLIGNLRELSPLSKGNYWIKSITVILSILGLSLNSLVQNIGGDVLRIVGILLVSLIVVEVLSIVLSYVILTSMTSKYPEKKSIKWQEGTLETYRHILEQFVDEAIAIYRMYYPSLSEVCGYSISEEDVADTKQKLIAQHIYLTG